MVPFKRSIKAVLSTVPDVREATFFAEARDLGAIPPEGPPEIAKTFELEFAPDMPPHESEWLHCPNFIVRRTSARASERPIERRKGSAHA